MRVPRINLPTPVLLFIAVSPTI